MTHLDIIFGIGLSVGIPLLVIGFQLSQGIKLALLEIDRIGKSMEHLELISFALDHGITKELEGFRDDFRAFADDTHEFVWELIDEDETDLTCPSPIST
jgi:hypothetical protein